MKIIKEVLPNPKIEKGFFELLKEINPALQFIDNTYDIEYYFIHSGNKIASDSFIDLSVDDFVSCINGKYGAIWLNVYNALLLEYNPIENYNSTESIELVTDNITTNATKQTIKDEQENNGQNITNNEELDSIYAFNKNKSNNASTINSNVDINSDKMTKDSTIENSGDITDKKDELTQVKKQGNIGVTTTQQMLQSEIDLRVGNILKELVFANVDTMLTLQIY